MRLSFADAGPELRAIRFALLLRALRVVTLLCDMVTTCLTGRARVKTATCRVESIGRGCLGDEGGLWVCSSADGIVRVEETHAI